MNKKLAEISCADFAEVLSSKEPVPGGGGVAALVGALGAALCSMVGNLTVGRIKYAAYEESVKRMLSEGETIRKRLLELIDEDAKAFEPLSKAYAIPKDDPKRQDILETATARACTAPIEIMRQICQAIDLLEEMLEKGSVTLVSDVGCGALCCKAALRSAALNIYINTGSLTDRDKARALDVETDGMMAVYAPKAENIAAETERRIRGGT